MIKCVNADELTKLDLQITSGRAYFNCPHCKNVFAVANCENFLEGASEMLKNKLVYNQIGEDKRAEMVFFDACPVCLKQVKIDLEFRLECEKRVMIFSTKCVEKPKKIKWIGLEGDLR